MAQITMYPAFVNSVETTTTNSISDTDTIIYVLTDTAIPNAPNLLVLGTGASAETVLMTNKTGNMLTVIRGVQGSARPWPNSTIIARNYTAYDHDTFKANIEDNATQLAQIAINVKSFGAKGDGVTDDTVAIQNALNDVPIGGRLFFPVGVYLANTLSINKSVILEGQKGSVLKSVTVGNNFITVNTSNVSFSDLVIDGDDKKARIVYVNASMSFVSIKKCEIKNAFDNDVSIEVAGVLVQGDNENIVIEDCHIHHVRATPNSVQGDNKGASRGVSFNPFGQTNPTKNSIVRHCLIEQIMPQEDSDGVAVGLSSQDEPTFIRIEGNTFRQCHKRAIKILGYGVTVKNNTIINDRPLLTTDWASWGTTEAMFAAISVYAGNVVIDGNTIKGGSYYMPIDVQGSSSIVISDVVISNNLIRPDTQPHRAIIAIYNDTGERFTITNNNLSNAKFGIDIRKRFVNGVIGGNVIENITERGILFDSFGGYILFDNNIVSNNRIQATQYGIDIQTGSTFVIVGNQLNPAWMGVRQSALATNVMKSGNIGVETSGSFIARTTSALPAANANSEGLMIRHSAGGTVNDSLRVCVRNSDGTFAWRQVTLT